MGELELLYHALGTPLGIVIRTNDFKLAQSRLYGARRKADDPELLRIQIRSSPLGDPNEIWLVRGQLPKARQEPDLPYLPPE